MPAAGYYKLYWRNPKTRVFEAVPGVHLHPDLGFRVRDSLVITGLETLAHWYTKEPGSIDQWKKGL